MFNLTIESEKDLNENIEGYNTTFELLQKDPDPTNKIACLRLCLARLAAIGATKSEVFLKDHYQKFNQEVQNVKTQARLLREEWEKGPTTYSGELIQLESLQELINKLPEIQSAAPEPQKAHTVIPPHVVNAQAQAQPGPATNRVKYASYALMGVGIFTAGTGAVIREGFKTVGEEAIKQAATEAAKKAAEEAMRIGMTTGVTVAVAGAATVATGAVVNRIS